MNDSLKKPLKIAIVLIVMILTLIVVHAGFNYLYYTLPPEQVKISVSYSPDTTCRKGIPLHMLITNGSYREIISTSFSLSVKKRVNKDNFIQLLLRDYSTDKVIKSGGSYDGCWTYPELNTKHYVPEELIYEIDRKQIMFRD